MPNYIEYNLTTGALIRKHYSLPESGAAVSPNGMLEVTEAQLRDLTIYTKVVAGEIREMTAEEKAKVGSDILAAQEAFTKIPSFEKLLTALIDKKIITLEEVKNATPYKY
ncbi:MAG TPA: hypothetical protein PLD92_04510 [Candidatus Omnitrophota bacterium]|nr:hypothetical protein [Candidatus Omnitrophota bacterium]